MSAPPKPELAREISAAASGYSLEDSPVASEADPDEVQAHSRRRRLDKVTLEKERAALIEECADCLGMEGDDAAIFLADMNWDVDSFTQSCFDDEAFLGALRKRLRVSEAPASLPPAADLCEICFCEPPVADVVPCGHGYCMDCWQRFVSLAVEEGKACLELRCPFPKCGERLRASQVQRLCSSQALVERYRGFLVDAFVQEHRGRKWCPSAFCELACERGAAKLTVNCECGMAWCFECSNDDHEPVPCKCVQEWNQKEVSEGNVVKWILANTKNCPKCKNPIEKNGGCMHMTCRKPGGCDHEFCWICMGDWKTHTACNAQPEQEAVRSARVELETYGFYWQRFREHEEAQRRTEGDLKERLAVVTACFLGEAQFSVKDTEFLSEACDQLARCRRFLKWTYAFAYFLSARNASTRKLFEFHQAQLEGTLERLSDIVENTDWTQYLDSTIADNQEFFQKRSSTISLTKIVHDFFENLAKWIRETFP